MAREVTSLDRRRVHRLHSILQKYVLGLAHFDIIVIPNIDFRDYLLG